MKFYPIARMVLNGQAGLALSVALNQAKLESVLGLLVSIVQEDAREMKHVRVTELSLILTVNRENRYRGLLGADHIFGDALVLALVGRSHVGYH